MASHLVTSWPEAMQSFGPLMAEPPQMSTTAPIAALGFDC